MPELTTEQRRILRTLVDEGAKIKDPRVRRIYERAAAQVGLVESGLRELDHGDADSQNWRQERESIYGREWARTGGALNTKASARRFREEFLQHYDPGERSWEVAAQVQRPREDLRGRYREEARAAAAALGQLGGGRSTRAGSRPTSTDRTVTRTVGGVDNQAARGALVASFLQGDTRFTKGTAADGVNPADPLEFALQMRQLKDVPGQSVTETVPGPTRRARRQSAPRGGGSLAPGGQFAGTTSPVIELAKIAHSHGLRTSSGKRDTVNTSSGNVSDHYRGNSTANARDLAGSVPDMDAAAVAIARKLGLKSYKRGQPLEATVVRDGIRYQLLYRTNTGGNHFDHIHVGARRV